MDVLRGVRTLYISTMYIVDNQTVKNMYKPKSVIRISLCRTAKRNPLIFPIQIRMIVVFLVIQPNIECACLFSSQIGWRRYQLVSDSLQKFFLVGIDQRMSEQRHEVICHDNEIPTCLCCPEVICDKVIDGEIILQFFYPKSVIRK